MTIALNVSTGSATAAANNIAANAANHSAGHLLVVIVAGFAYNVTVNGIQDSGNDVFSPIINEAIGATGDIEIWYAKNINGNNNNVVTATFSGNQSYRNIIVLEYSGMDTASPVDSNATGNGTSGNQVTASSNASSANALIVAGYYEYSGGTFTPGANFTLEGVIPAAPSSLLGAEAQILGAAGNYFSAISIASQKYIAVHAIFKATGGIDQEGFRFRNDDGDEAAATWDGDQDAPLSEATGVKRLRTIVNASGDPDAAQYQLEWLKVGEDIWRKVED
jgi:hypothetical protein